MTALVHDYLLVMRGAERTFAAMAECFPSSGIYTLLYDHKGTEGRFGDRSVRTSYLQRLGVSQAGFRRLLPLFPGATERLELGEHDLVVSSSSAFAHGVRAHEDAVHVCYCHSPFRYAWHERERAVDEVPRPLRPAVRRTLGRIRRWDLEASRRVTHYIANSAICRDRIADYWGREASVVHPPVDTERFRLGVAEDFFLIVSELVAHKRVDVALEAARRTGQHVKVVGTGPDMPRLQARYGERTEFLGRIGDPELSDLYGRARALIVPNVEEFGIAAVEAQASGRPVLATDAGGTAETVVDGTTGVLLPPGDADALAEAIRYTDFDSFSPSVIKVHAEQFSQSVFELRLIEEVKRAAATGG